MVFLDILQLNCTMLYSKGLKIQGYNFCVYDDFKAVGMEDSADIHVELVKLVDGLSRAHVPQHTII